MKIYQRDKLNVLSAGTYHFIKFNVFFQGGIVPLKEDCHFIFIIFIFIHLYGFH